MKFGFSGEGFGNLLVLNAFIVIIIVFVAIWMAPKRGINIKTTRFQLSLLLGCVFVFGVIPLWLSDLPVGWKVVVTAAAVLVAIGNFFGTGRLQKIAKEHFFDERKKKDQGIPFT